MTEADVKAHLAGLSDDEIMEKAVKAFKDMLVASMLERNSDWHNACYAAAVIYGTEAKERGLLVE